MASTGGEVLSRAASFIVAKGSDTGLARAARDRRRKKADAPIVKRTFDASQVCLQEVLDSSFFPHKEVS